MARSPSANGLSRYESRTALIALARRCVVPLQAALMGLPQPRPLGEEMALLESGRAGSTASSAGPEAAASTPAAAVAGVGPMPPPQQQQSMLQRQQPQPPAVLEGAGGSTNTPDATVVDGEPQTPQLQPPTEEAATTARQGASPVAEAALRAPASQASATPPPRPTAPTTAPSSSLLSRPQLPPTPSPTASADGVPVDSDTSSPPSNPNAPPQVPAATSFDPAAATAAAAAAARERYERQQATHGTPLPSEPWTTSDVFKALWSCAKMNRHPGPHILAAAERSWRLHTTQREDTTSADGTACAAGQLQQPPLHALTGLLWALATFRQHNGSFAQLLATQLADRLASDNDALSAPSLPHMQRQPRQMQPVRSMQLASCLLAAQADRSDCPLAHALGPEGRARCIAAWRSKCAARAAQPPNRYQSDLLAVLRKMGFAAAANVATPDGCTLVDVAVALPPPPAAAAAAQPGQPPAAPPAPRLLALELVGRHNSAVNSPRITGEAVLKYRLLQVSDKGGAQRWGALARLWTRRDVRGVLAARRSLPLCRTPPAHGTGLPFAAIRVGPCGPHQRRQARRLLAADPTLFAALLCTMLRLAATWWCLCCVRSGTASATATCGARWCTCRPRSIGGRRPCTVRRPLRPVRRRRRACRRRVRPASSSCCRHLRHSSSSSRRRWWGVCRARGIARWGWSQAGVLLVSSMSKRTGLLGSLILGR